MEKNINKMTLTISADTKNQAFARSVVAAFCTELNPTVSELNDIKTAVSEAVTNCIVHAYENDNSKDITITGIIDGCELTVQIADEGKGIKNIEQAIQPFFTTKEGEERSGMGFTVMQTFMDKVEVFSALNKGTTVVMKKLISREGEVIDA